MFGRDCRENGSVKLTVETRTCRRASVLWQKLLKELRRSSLIATQPFQGCFFYKWSVFPGLPKRNPGLQLANAFSVKRKLHLYTRPGSVLNRTPPAACSA